MSIVLRCPNCGTTQRHGGECEACSEGEVQYFCANHAEGIWLAGPSCSQCGAKVGDPPRRRAPAPPPPPLSTPPAGPPEFRPPTRRRTGGDSEEPDLAGRRRSRELDDPAGADGVPLEPSLVDLLEEITEAHARRRAPRAVEVPPWAEPPRRGIGFPIGGCLVRLFGLGLLLFLAFVIFLFVLFGGLIGG